jgi:hypothetical protein
MKELVRTGNTLKGKPTQFCGAKLSKEQISTLSNITRANFRGYVKVVNNKVPTADQKLMDKLINLIK